MKKLLLCAAFAAAFFTNALAQITVTGTATDLICVGSSDGCVDLVVTGGTPPYTYLWSNNATTVFICNLPAATYSVTVTDALSASATTSVTVNEPAPILISETHNDALCYGSCDGAIFITVTNGTPPYIYDWSNGTTTQNQNNLCAGTYTVAVYDSNGCLGTTNVTIAEPPLITFTESHTDVLCNGICNGTILITPSGGSGSGYQYSNNGFTYSASNPITGLCANVYQVVVKDGNGCTASAQQVTIFEPTPITITGTVNNATCNGGCDGAIVVSIFGGVAPYSYAWSNGMTTQNVTNACAGTYSITVVDANGCDAAVIYTIQNSGSGNITVAGVVTNTTCGQNTGAIDITVTGGTGSYYYLWSNNATSEDIAGLNSGLYMVTVADSLGCYTIETFAVNDTNGISLSLVATDMYCNNPGTITATVSGASIPYVINWGDGTADVVTVLPPVHNYSAAGTYTVIVSDSFCLTSASATINDSSIVVSLIETVQPTGCTIANGKLKVAVTGGTPPYTYLWSNGATADSIVNVAAGTYTVTVSDNGSCTVSQTFTLTANNPGFAATTTTTNVNCSNGNQGSATVIANGGILPYTYLWSTGATTQTITGLSVGVYMVTVTDSSGCFNVRPAYVNYSNQSFYVYLTTVSPNCGNNGSITATPSNGTGPYTYLWSNGATTQTISGLSPGNYTVTVTDSTGCQRIVSRTLTTTCYNVITGTIYNDANGNCIKDSSESYLSGYTITATNGTQYHYGTANANGNFTIYVTNSGTFTLSAYYSYNCTNVTFCGNNTAVFAGVGDTVVKNLAFNSVNGFDLSLFANWTGANPGFQKSYNIYYYNYSAVPFSGTATITFQYDAQLVYQNSNPSHATHDAINHILTWNVNNVPNNYTYGGPVSVNFLVPVNTPVNYVVNTDLLIEPTAGDCDPADNQLQVSQIVTGSFDPNEKQVLPEGDIYDEDSVLTYTIHFQNTGNDTTHFVVLKDTLSEYLDAASVENIASSHLYSEFDISGEGILTWTFNPLYLPDSSANEPESKGFVMFRVKKRSNLPLNTIISNTASIYFDYNSAIVTNTVENTITEPVGIWNWEMDNLVSVYPNPANNELRIQSYEFEISSVRILDVAGKEVGSYERTDNSGKSAVVLNISDVSNGLYFIHTQLINGTTVVKKVVKE